MKFKVQSSKFKETQRSRGCARGGARFRTSNFELRASAFTLVEMVIVVAVVLLILGIVLPAASTLWKQRRVSEAQNTISGMLMSARAKAMENDFGDSGLFFYLDDAGVQRIASITQDASKAANPQTREPWANVFNVTSERTYTMPVPMRVVPRYVICDSDRPEVCNIDPSDAQLLTFDDDELTNNDVMNPVNNDDPFQRHRNYFTLIYNGNGQLLVRRDVLISDKNDDASAQPPTSVSALGDVTELLVADETEVTKYHGIDRVTGNAAKLSIILNDGPTPPDDYFVVDPDNVAINFPSVDGLLVYDESLFSNAGTAEQKREYLLNAAQPFYIHRLTGAVIRGPVGEAVAKTP